MATDTRYTKIAHQPLLAPMALAALWRHKTGKELRLWQKWLADESLLDDAAQKNLIAAQDKLAKAQFTIAVVAEVSRGKSELINAMLFAQHGKRIVPSGVGRTTVCPTEFFCDEDEPPFIELLPLASRVHATSLDALRHTPSAWTRHTLDDNDSDALAQALLKVCEIQRVTHEQAQQFGLEIEPFDAAHGLAIEQAEPALVDVPMWRYARVNLHHPLLASGLAILDTPGLNVLGHEPELTYAVLPTVDAVLFLLAADVGVTRSDQTAWKTHLGHLSTHSKWGVLNKIDTLTDALRSPLEIQTDIIQQIDRCADALDISKQQVLAVSARQGLLARIKRDDVQLNQSRLPQLENSLTTQLLGRGKKQLRTQALHALEFSHRLAVQHLTQQIALSQTQLTELQALGASDDPQASLNAYKLDTEKRQSLQAILTQSIAQTTALQAASMNAVLSSAAFHSSFNDALDCCETGSVTAIKQHLHSAIVSVHARLMRVIEDAQLPLSASRKALARINKLNGIVVSSGLSQAPQFFEPLAFDSELAELKQLSQSCGNQLPILPMLSSGQRKKATETVLAIRQRCTRIGIQAKQQCELWLATLNQPIFQGLAMHQRMLDKRNDNLNRMAHAQESLSLNLSVLNQNLAADQACALRLKERYTRAIVALATDGKSPA